MLIPLIVDLETTTPGKKPDFRYDTITQVGWLPLDGDTAYWSDCLCPLPPFDPIICHNAMYDVGILWRLFMQKALKSGSGYGIKITNEWLRSLNIHDTMALAYCAGAEDLSLPKPVSWKQRATIGEEQYLAQDLFETRDYFNKLMAKNEGTAYDIDRRLIPALIDCSYRGYEIDQDRLEQAIWEAARTCNLQQGLFDRLIDEEEEMVLVSRRKVTRKKWPEDVSGLYGDDIVVGDGLTRYRESYAPPDIGSPIQLARMFGLPNADVVSLKAMAGDLRADSILTWRGAAKLFTTYYMPHRNQDRMSGLFNITPPEEGEDETTTGRLSSERVNMQNQTPLMQRCLRAPDGYLLRRGDYPQLELRCAAQISQDPVMLEALNDPNRDLHQEAADRLFNGDRQRGKAFNFKELYIAGEQVRSMYPRWYDWCEEQWSEVQRTGISVLPEPLLHKRMIPLLELDHARRQAINHPSQGLAGYIMKDALAVMFEKGSQLVNQIHDAGHDYVPEDGNRDLQRKELADIMTEVAWKYLPDVGATVKAEDIKISRYWEDKK